MAPLPDDWKILSMDEDITFGDNEKDIRARHTKASAKSASHNAPHPAERKSSEFGTRVKTAIVLAPLVLAAVAVGGVAFYTLVLLTAVLMMREWDAMIEHRLSPRWGWSGVAYVTATCLAFILLREPSLGGSLHILIFLLAVVWATDIGAYFAGRAIGGPKLAPRISPNKTWAGLLGGVLCATAAGAFLSAFFPFPPNIVYSALLSAALAVMAQAGDLFESWMKRQAGMKDSSSLIPGHGGILDRVDGLTFSAPFLVIVYYFYLWSFDQMAETTIL